MKFDLHIHSSHSPDSTDKVAVIMDKARHLGLDGISITDHDSLDGSLEALSLDPPDLMVIPGAEYSTDMGHLLVYFLENGLEKLGLPRDSLGRYRWQELVAAARRQGALVFLAHPYKRRVQYQPGFLDAIDGLEIYNSRAALCREKDANLMAFEEARRLGKPFSAGSDAHWPGEVGKAYWEFKSSIINADDKASRLEEVKHALEEGKGRVCGRASSRLYEPASQIMKNLRAGKFHRLLKPLLKMGYSLAKEAARWAGLEKKPLEGLLEIHAERGD